MGKHEFSTNLPSALIKNQVNPHLVYERYFNSIAIPTNRSKHHNDWHNLVKLVGEELADKITYEYNVYPHGCGWGTSVSFKGIGTVGHFYPAGSRLYKLHPHEDVG